MTEKKTKLYDQHVALAAKMTPFGGFLMPVWYTGIRQEHLAVRQHAGVFDISHMGLFSLWGPGTEAFLEQLSCNSLEKTKDGLMVYSMMLNEQGGILDDVMIGRIDDRFLLVVNASNKSKMAAWMTRHKPDSVTIDDLNVSSGFLAIQGPQAVSRLSETIDASLAEKKRFSLSSIQWQNQTLLVLATGYTGEDGFEIIAPNSLLDSLWGRVIASGITPCGLGARDSLRLEAGLPLYGQELSETLTPLSTRYQWVVKWSKEFIGKEALEKTKPDWITVGFVMEDRVIPRTHYPILEGGEVTSGPLSPSLDCPIGMALVKPDLAAPGSKISVIIRDKPCPASVVALPFVKRGHYA